VAVIIAGSCWASSTRFWVGDATFKQVFAIVAHFNAHHRRSSRSFALPLDYVRETDVEPNQPERLRAFLEENSFLARLLGAISPLSDLGHSSRWQIGLGVFYKRTTAPIATDLFIVYFVIVAAVAAIRSALS